MITNVDFEQIVRDSLDEGDGWNVAPDFKPVTAGKKCFELAKEMTIGFAKWTSENGWVRVGGRTPHWIKSTKIGQRYDAIHKTDDEVFKLFLASNLVFPGETTITT